MTHKTETNMTTSKAIKIARERVRVVGYGDGRWQVHEHRPAQNVTFLSGMTSHERVVAQAKEARIKIALDLLGVEDAGAIASVLVDEPGRAEDLIRRQMQQPR